MPSRSPRIVPRGLQRGSILISILCGTIAGAASSWWHMFALNHYYSFMGTTTALGVPVMLAPVLLVYLWIQLLALYIPRRRAILRASMAGCAAVIPAFMATEGIRNFYGGLGGLGFLSYATMITVGAGLFVAFGACLGLCARWIAHATSRPVEQTGTYCWHCAYDLSAGPTGAVCPECGIDPAHATPRWRLITALIRRINGNARAITAVATAMAMAALGWWLVVWMIPIRQFVTSPALPSTFPPGGLNVAYMTMPNTPGPPTFDKKLKGVNISLAIDGPPDRLVMVAYFPRADPDSASMIIEYAAMHSFQSMRNSIRHPVSMLPSVKSYLGPEQARAVMSRGVPQPLIDALIAEADAANEIPMPAVTANSQYHSPIAVDAAPFFPGLTPYTGRTLTY